MTDVKNIKAPPRRRGRPRAFDRDEVLARATETFWRLGYEGASITDLTAAMGITPQSLYSAFTSKAELYREALGWYQSHVEATTARALEEDDVGMALARVLNDSAHEFTRPERPRGCMISMAVLACAVENQPVAQHVSSLRNETLDALKARIARGVDEGQLRPGTDVAALARFVGAMIQGMSVQAQDGASKSALSAMANLAIAEIERHRV
ncbi:TetR/AcrR family transcriptional regulator [Pseudooceanicola sp. CBS1P-1]|uniref:TetR family transcriptional regulator n=1 Tax=Pseudooceanicola albus TaxID=2692189 RepID=A0A6L7GCU3_9RHOB|nr:MULTISPECIES: TetR/AcrR family transcriptional regulator [Pseudooceanicola]MBT9386896.1 TetR/AcrR family transcriptional regulator [Pseudooceanicola endophyticus]MXN21050.1 TetR family transcriptional regulator [Pseudooceanicola albus]